MSATALEAQGLSSVPQRAAGNPAPLEAPPAPRFPGTELVSAAAALFQTGPRWDGGEGRRFRVVVSAGTVGVRMTDPARLERNGMTALDIDPRGSREVLAPPTVEWEGVHYSFTEHDRKYVTPEREEQWREARPGRQIEGWSRKSRARMVRTLAQLDLAPMYAGGTSAMVTLTYPGDWLTVAPTGRAVKAHLKAFGKRWGRAWGEPPRLVWKLEFQRRGAPHLHLLVVPPAGTAVCTCSSCRCWCLLPDCADVCGRRLLFREWLSHAWADVVAHPDPLERRRHVLAGTGVDYARGGRCFDPKRAAVYFSKHGGAAGGKEYQHGVPVEWQGTGDGPGRFWGYWRLEVVTAAADLELRDYLVVRRTLRRWSEAQDRTRTSSVPRVDTRTGVVRSRKVTRRARYVGQGGLTGGTVLVNDGPAFAARLSRLVGG